MSKHPVVLSIEDNQANQDLIEMSLGDYEIHAALDGQSGIETAKSLQPDVILLDVSMPGIDGYETCRRLKADPDTAAIPIVFISAMNSIEDRMQGYKSGGEDYICKPVDFEELAHKIEVLLTYRTKVSNLDEQLKSASNVAMTAMSQSSELGTIISFVESSIRCEKIHELVDKFFECLSAYSLNGSMVVRFAGAEPSYFSMGEITPIETQLLSMSEGGKRIVGLGKRAMFNMPLVSLLIKDMPVEDNEDKAGRLRDHLSTLLICAESRLEALHHESMAKNARSHALDELVGAVRGVMKNVLEQTRVYQAASKAAIDNLSLELETEFIKLALPEAAEQHLLSLVDKLQNRVDDALDIGAELDGMLQQLIVKLKSLDS